MATKKTAQKKPTNPATARKQLANELSSLRGQFHDITARYQANVEARLVACINCLSGNENDGLPCVAKKQSQLTALVKAVQELKLKPQKGRLKDIRAIHELTKTVAEQLDLE